LTFQPTATLTVTSMSSISPPTVKTPGYKSALLALTVSVAAFAAACGSADNELVAGSGDLGHIHDLVVTGDGVLLVASHTGLYRIDDIDRAVLVGDEHHDLMAMTSTNEEHLLASGHPDLRLEHYRVDDHPAFLGLATSTDGGASWAELDLLGAADFHALVLVGDDLYAAETTGRIWHRDSTGTWAELGDVEARDLAIDPSNTQNQLAPGYDGVVWASVDGANTWNALEDAPSIIEIEWIDSGSILGVDEAGTIWSTESINARWNELARGPSEVETFHIDDSGAWWITVHGGGISQSIDQGQSWIDVYIPPDGP